MRNYDFDESIGFWMLSGSQAYFRMLTAELAPHGVTFRQSQVLALLVHRGPMCQAAMASAMDIEPPGLVGVLDRMEKQGLVQRQTSTTDRRKRIVHLTPQADHTWNLIVEAALKVRQRAVTGISEEQVDQLKVLLKQVVANLRL